MKEYILAVYRTVQCNTTLRPVYNSSILNAAPPPHLHLVLFLFRTTCCTCKIQPIDSHCRKNSESFILASTVVKIQNCLYWLLKIRTVYTDWWKLIVVHNLFTGENQNCSCWLVKIIIVHVDWWKSELFLLTGENQNVHIDWWKSESFLLTHSHIVVSRSNDWWKSESFMLTHSHSVAKSSESFRRRYKCSE